MGISSLVGANTFAMKVITALLALAAAAHGRPDGPVPAYAEYPHASPVYAYNYDVNNDGIGYEHQAFRQEEERSGHQTHGEYSVQLADAGLCEYLPRGR